MDRCILHLRLRGDRRSLRFRRETPCRGKIRKKIARSQPRKRLSEIFSVVNQSRRIGARAESGFVSQAFSFFLSFIGMHQEHRGKAFAQERFTEFSKACWAVIKCP